jgi:flagellar motor switch protein FliG
MSNMNFKEMTPVQKTAVALVVLGQEVTAHVFKELPEGDLEAITLEIANLRDVPPEIKEKVMLEFKDILIARTYITQGGVDYARAALENAIGATRATEILNRLESSFASTGFSMMKDIDAKQLVGFLQSEHPQTISLVLTQLNAQHAAAVLTELPPELQAEVALRVATMEKIAPEILTEIEGTLQAHFEGAGGEVSASGGAKSIAEILNLIDTSAEKNILQGLEAEDPDLAAEIKNMMFVFDDIILLDDRSIQRLLKEIETKDLSLALKAASDTVKSKIFTNVSSRVKTMIEEEMEFMGPTRLSDVEAAQSRIVEAVRRLEEEGQIIISGRGGKEDVIV